MSFEIPVAPAIVLTLIGFLAPYVIAALNGVLPFVTSGWWRRVIAVAASIILAGLGLVGWQLFTGEPLPSTPSAWVTAVLLVLVVCQASYALVTKGLGADWITRRITGDAPDSIAARYVSKANGR